MDSVRMLALSNRTSLHVVVPQGQRSPLRLNTMANDGCQKPVWSGTTFSYLPYAPNAAQDSYARASNTAGASQLDAGHRGADMSGRQAATGVWDGPRPTGNLAEAAAEAQQSVSGRAKDYVLLPGGTIMPLLGYGTNSAKDPAIIRHALEAGYRHFDCASIYKTEEQVGEGLREFIADGRRQELFVTSKLFQDAHRPSAVRHACEESIARLGCSYLDLYLVHWPEAWKPREEWKDAGKPEDDPGVTLEDTWKAMEDLVDAGLARNIGVSNFSLPQVDRILAAARVRPAVNQIESHPLLAQRKLVGGALRKGIHTVAYSPLGAGSLNLIKDPTVAKIAEATGRSPAQVLLKWNLQRGVGVIPRSTNPANIKSNIDGLFEWQLSQEQKATLDNMDQGKRAIDPAWHDWEAADKA